jgi:WD40 repeat protein
MSKHATWGLTVLLALSVAGRSAEEPVLKDRAVLELTVPDGAQVSIDDVEQGDKRRFSYGPLRPGERKTVDVRVRFPERGETYRTVHLQGGWHVRLPLLAPTAVLPELVLQSGHSLGVSKAAFSSDGRLLLTTANYAKMAILWDAETGRQLRTFTPEERRPGSSVTIVAVALSPDGRQVLVGLFDGRAILWDARTGLWSNTFTFGSILHAAAFSPDGKQILVGLDGGGALLYEAATSKTLRSFPHGTVTDVGFSRDGKRIVTSSRDRTVILWDTTTGEKLQTFQGHKDAVRSVDLSSDGARVATASSDSTAILWDAATGRKLHTLAANPAAVKFTSDGSQVLTADTAEREATLWNARTGEKQRTFAVRSAGLAFRPNTRQVLLGDDLWDLETGQKVFTLPGHYAEYFMSALTVLPEKQQFLIALDKSQFLRWDAGTGARLCTSPEGKGSIVFSADGKQMLTSGPDNTGLLWEVDTGRKLQTFRGHGKEVFTLAFSPDGKRILTGSYDKTAILWDSVSGKALRTFRGHEYWIHQVAFSPDGKQVLTGAIDSKIFLWDVQTGEKQHELKGSRAAFSSDGKLVASGHMVVESGRAHHLLLLWDASSGKLLRHCQGHSHLIHSVTFSPDGRWLLTGSSDLRAILWDVETGEKLHVLKGHTGSLRESAFVADGRLVLTVGADTTLHLWDSATGSLLARLVPLDHGKDWLAVTPEGLFDGSAGGRQRVAYRIGTGLNVVPVDRFFQDFYRPGLIADLWRGERPLPAVQLARNRPPRVRIVSPARGGTVESTEVTLDVQVVDEGGGVRGPWLFHNGARLLAEGDTRKDETTVVRRFRTRLVEGDNKLEVRAASEDGSWESEPAELTLRYDRPLDKGILYVVAVGVSKYADDSLSLKFAADDARALVALFQRRGQSLYRKVHPLLLPDDRATRAGIREALDEIARKAQPQDTLVVFLAGHGTMVGQRYYFIPHELRRRPGRSLETDVTEQGIAHDELGDLVTRVPALKRVLLFDTCCSGGAIAVPRTARNPFSLRGAVERLGRSRGVFTLAAAAATEEAQEVRELGHGVLTYALLAGLNAVDGGPLLGKSVKPGQTDAVADVLEWFTFASDRVPELTRKYYGRDQDVQMSSQGNNFPILPVRDG